MPMASRMPESTGQRAAARRASVLIRSGARPRDRGRRRGRRDRSPPPGPPRWTRTSRAGTAHRRTGAVKVGGHDVRRARWRGPTRTRPRPPCRGSPPNRERITDSTRNWRRMSRRRAPSALRTPISRMRSVTETSMMFMTTTPPTSRLMPVTTIVDHVDAAGGALPQVQHALARLDREVVGLVEAEVAAGAHDHARLVLRGARSSPSSAPGSGWRRSGGCRRASGRSEIGHPARSCPGSCRTRCPSSRPRPTTCSAWPSMRIALPSGSHAAGRSASATSGPITATAAPRCRRRRRSGSGRR